MNYASVFLVFILGAAGVYWFISGRKFYHGPIVEAQAGEDSDGMGGSGKPELSEGKHELDGGSSEKQRLEV